MWHPVAKPRHLALGKLPRGGDGRLQRLVPAEFAPPPGPAAGAGPAAWRPAARGPARPGRAASSSPPCSTIASKRAAMRARSSARGGSSTKAASLQSFSTGAAGRVLPFRQRPAGGLEHFIGAQHALRIAGAQLRGRQRIALGQSRMQAPRRRSRPAARAPPRAPRPASAGYRPGRRSAPMKYMPVPPTKMGMRPSPAPAPARAPHPRASGPTE